MVFGILGPGPGDFHGHLLETISHSRESHASGGQAVGGRAVGSGRAGERWTEWGARVL